MEKSKRKNKNKREKCSSRRFKKKIRASEVNRHTVVMIDVMINLKRMKRKLERRAEPFFPTFKILPRADHREIRNLEEIVKNFEVVDTFWETPEQ